jgi:hypothetical protein
LCPCPRALPETACEQHRIEPAWAYSMTDVQCVVCETARAMPPTRQGRGRIPRGWKMLRGEPHCPACKGSAFVLRALILPIARPEGASWPEFRAQLQRQWRETTRCANWMISELYARDIRREPDDQRLRPMPSVYLYPEARALFPVLSAQAVGQLAQDILRRYRAVRFDLLWSRRCSLPTYRYPVALTVPTLAWSLHASGGRWTVSARVGDTRQRFLLRGGPEMRRQSRRLEQIVTGEAERGSLTIYETASAADGALAASRGTRVMVKIAAWLPKTATAPAGAVIEAGTDGDALLRADARWRIDPAPLRSVLAAEQRRREALLTNLQVARLHSGQRRDGIERALRELSRRSQARMADACRTYAAHLAAHALARGARAVHYDDRVRPALPHFPWEQLRRRIAEKLDEQRIAFVHVNGAVIEPVTVACEGGGEHAA